MFIKKQIKHTSSTRHQINTTKYLLSKFNNITKNLFLKKISSGGRNNTGRITIRHKGSGCKGKTHVLDSPQKAFSICLTKMYNPKKHTFISLNFDLKRKSFFKSIAIKNACVGSLSQYGISTDLKLSYRLKLGCLPSGSIVSSVSQNNKSSVYARSAGTFCQLMEKVSGFGKIKLPSGNFILVNLNEFAFLGKIDNSIAKQIKLGKAGRNRLKGVRPSVRGIAMNPVDHPHGGKSNKGMIPVTPWGLPTKGKPTVIKK
jgi:large subunit ribosomal protein L2